MKWLKSLFKKKETEIVEIEQEKLLEWFNKRTSPILVDIKDDIKNKFLEIEELKKQMNEKIEALKNASLRNENIPERAKQVMEGSRQTYIKCIKAFSESINPPEEIDIDQLTDFISEFEEKSNSFTKTTARSYYVLQEFFSVESSAIAERIKNMDIIIRNIFDNKLKKIADVEKRIKELDSDLKKKHDISEQAYKEENKLESINKQIEEANEDMKRLRASKAFTDAHDLLKEKEESESKLKKQGNVLSGMFSQFDKAMRKYERIALDNQRVLQKYIDNSLNALLKDEKLVILEVLSKLKDAIINNTIELKDKDKVLARLDVINEETLRTGLKSYTQLKDNLESLDKQIKNNTALKEFEEMEYKQKHLTEKYNRCEEETNKLKKQIEKYDISGMRTKLEKSISALLDIEFKILSPSEEETQTNEEHD